MKTIRDAHAKTRKLVLIHALLVASAIALLTPAPIHAAAGGGAKEGQGGQGKVKLLVPPADTRGKDLQNWTVVDGHKMEQVYSADFLQSQKGLLKRLQELEPKFKTLLMGVSVPIRVVRTKDGRELYVLRGCKPHDCGETARVVVYSPAQGSAFVLISNYAPGRVGILGSPDETIEDLLIYYHINWAED